MRRVDMGEYTEDEMNEMASSNQQQEFDHYEQSLQENNGTAE